jgi:DNA-directed RNA polymerase specialized sigma subunit
MRFYLNLTTLFLSFKIFASDSCQGEIFDFSRSLEHFQFRFEELSQEERAHEWELLKNQFSAEFQVYLKRTIDRGSVDDIRFVFNFPSLDFNLQNDEFGDTYVEDEEEEEEDLGETKAPSAPSKRELLALKERGPEDEFDGGRKKGKK